MGISMGFVTLFFLARLYARVIVKKVWILEDCKLLRVLYLPAHSNFNQGLF